MALDELRGLQTDGSRVFKSEQLSRTARERLVDSGFLQEVMKGWLVSASPSSTPGDTTPWFSSFWEFCRRYCDERFGEDWFLQPEESLLLHAEKTAIPKQVIVASPSANNKRIDLAHATSLFALKKEMPSASDLVRRDGLSLFSVEAALVRAHESFFRQNPVEARTILEGIREPSALLSRLLDGGHTVVAGRLVGALRRNNQGALADEIVRTMRSAGHTVRESDPFEEDLPNAPAITTTSPFIARLQALWHASRGAVLDELAEPPRRSGASVARRLAKIDDVYKLDAYHSLSIEGYVVTDELVGRVASGTWDPDRVEQDRQNRDALAARGYWLAFQNVRGVVAGVLAGDGLGVLRRAHREWYRDLFTPHVRAGLLQPSMLAGYRTQPVFLRGSRHIPPRAEVLRDAMPALFDLIESEESALVRAVLAHWLFGYVHPFPDGNGRVARFLMNVLLVEAGYSWTVIRSEERVAYLDALEAASVDGAIAPFARFIGTQMGASSPRAPKRQRPRQRRGRSTRNKK